MSSWKSCVFVGLILVAGCKEASTPVPITSVVPEAAGQNCAGGGVAILVGVDTNNDGAVSATEASSTSYVCNGQVAPGTLVRASDEPAGANCEFGGTRLQTGPDTNRNGTLEDGEATATQYICDEGAGAPSLLRKTLGAPADERCPGGWVRLAWGLDVDGSGTLESAEEQTVFSTCNAVPSISPRTIAVGNCAQNFTLPLVIADLDGTVASVAARVLASGSAIAVTVDSSNRVVLTGGMHVGAAVIEVTATDDLGGRATAEVVLEFNGTGCLPDLTFHGVQPQSCVGVEVNPLAGDDRSGPVLASRGAYYNGDLGLVLVTVDAMGRMDAGLLVERTVDTLMGDSTRSELLSLWSSTWSADGGAFDAGLLDAPTTTWGAGAVFDELAAIDESTFQPTRRVALPGSVQTTFDAVDTADGGMTTRTFTTDRVLLSAADGHALVALLGYGPSDTALRFMLVDTTSGAAVVDRSVILTQATPNPTDWLWQEQEDETEFQHYALTRRGSAFWLTYKSRSSGWYELELASGSPVLRTESFGRNCDLQNLALTANGRQAWFHTEGDCFDVVGRETVIRCDTLRFPNLDGGVDDTGGPPPQEF